MKPQGCWLRSRTRITDVGQLIGMCSLAAYLRLQLLWRRGLHLKSQGGAIFLTPCLISLNQYQSLSGRRFYESGFGTIAVSAAILGAQWVN
ncbi:hypothetical protein DVQ42_06850 [Yersinia enterocolitica]|nr:hypothetical protein [Yersinia enterocolitica]EKN6349090.1 hypothetical protein [Yersinia enterocolitica]